MIIHKTPTRRAVAIIEKRLGQKIAGRLVEMRPDLRDAVKRLARMLAKQGN